MILLKLSFSSSQDVVSPNTSPQKGAPILKIDLSARVTRNVINAPSEKLPLKETTNEVCNTRSKASPAKVEMKAGGVASISFVNNGAYKPNRIASRQIINAATYCSCLLPPLDKIAFTGPVKHVDTAPKIAEIIDHIPHTLVIVLTGGLCPRELRIAMPCAF